MESHTLKINSNPISQSEIPENATVVQYDTLTGESRNIANNAIDQDSLFDQTYNYEQSRSNKPAEQFTSADYLQFDNTYYPIFASTNTYNKPDLNDIMENTIAKFLGMFAVLSTIAGIGGSLRQY